MKIQWSGKQEEPQQDSNSLIIHTQDEWTEDTWTDLMLWLEESPSLLYGTFDIFRSILNKRRYLIYMSSFRPCKSVENLAHFDFGFGRGIRA